MVSAATTAEGPVEFAFPAMIGWRDFIHPTTVILDLSELRWNNMKGAGRVRYEEITVIELQNTDRDPGDYPDCCVIWTASGKVLKLPCLKQSLRTYVDFVTLLHRRLSPADRARIIFRTEPRLTPKAEKLLVYEYLISVVVMIALIVAFGHPMGMCFAWIGSQAIYSICIIKLIPKRPIYYCPDPLDEDLLPK